jgi:hypothetical protein
MRVLVHFSAGIASFKKWADVDVLPSVGDAVRVVAPDSDTLYQGIVTGRDFIESPSYPGHLDASIVVEMA